MARIQIVDTGPGIPADELARIFEPFERGSSAAGQSASGTGLKLLTISKMLTDRWGGRNECVQSTRAGHHLRDPAVSAPAASSSLAPTQVRGVRTGYAGQRRRVWVVDNEEADRGLLVRILEPLGFDVMTLSPVWRAWPCCDIGPVSMKPDAIFMDLARVWMVSTMAAIRAGADRRPGGDYSANAFGSAPENTVWASGR